MFDFVAGPGLQLFEFRLQAPGFFSQGLEFRLRTCQHRIPGIVERPPSFSERGFLLIQLLLPGLDASLGPGSFPLQLGDSHCSAITIGTNGFQFLIQRSRVGSVARRALANELLEVAFAETRPELPFKPLLLPPALGDEPVIMNQRRGSLVFLHRFASQTVGLGQRLFAGAAFRKHFFQAVDREALEQPRRCVGPLRFQPRSSLPGIAGSALNLDLSDTLQLKTEARRRGDRDGPSQVVGPGWALVGAGGDG